jgi:predicted pyridoxine 5'-phosphate oxidase superfamily flavin-nucleotide-binding protein
MPPIYIENMGTTGKAVIHQLTGWHEGEIAVQERAGVLEEMGTRPPGYKQQIPAGMAAFITQQGFGVISTQDDRGRIWASLLAGNPGMIQIDGSNSIRIEKAQVETPLPVSDVRANPRIGMIVIDFSRRIRVRINGVAQLEDDGSLLVNVEQLYGNCSQYIQKRVLDEGAPAHERRVVSESATLNDEQQQFIHGADTFFIASRHPEFGADASHRGGMSGFVSATAGHISFPDYPGNHMFNTLGNLAVHPSVGLLFFDFERGRTLQVSGHGRVDWTPERSSALGRAERVLDIDVAAVRDTLNATSIRYRFIGYSPTLG